MTKSFRDIIYFLVFLLCSDLSLSFSLQSRARGGFTLDPSCAPYKSRIDTAIAATLELAKQGVAETNKPDSVNFPTYFRPQDAKRVRTVLRNLARSLNGYGPVIPVYCIEDDVCQRGNAAYVYYEKDLATGQRQDSMHLCIHAIDGKNPLAKLTSDFCAPRLMGLSLAENLLHEMLHIYSVANKTEIVDYVYQNHECKELAKGNGVDQNGNPVDDPTYNAQSYVLMAWNAIYYRHLTNPALCPVDARGELRKLLSDAGNGTEGCNGDDDGDDNDTRDASGNVTYTKGNLTQPYYPDVADYNPKCANNISASLQGDRLLIQTPPNSSDIYVKN